MIDVIHVRSFAPGHDTDQREIGSLTRRAVPTGTDTSDRVVDCVGVITFTRPERRNALHEAMCADHLGDRGFASRPGVGCVVVTGEGSAFCAGVTRDAPQPPARRLGRRASGGSFADGQLRVSVLLHGHRSSRSPLSTVLAVGAGLRSPRLRPAHRRLVGAFIGGWACWRSRRLRRAVAADAQRAGPSKALELLATNDDRRRRRRSWGSSTASCPTTSSMRLTAWAAQFAAGPQTARLPQAEHSQRLADVSRRCDRDRSEQPGRLVADR